MVDFRPVAYVIGRILIVLAILMLAPAIIDWRAGLVNGYDFLASAALTGVVGAGLTLSTANALGKPLDTRQAYLLTAGTWFLVPFFSCLPLWLGAPGLSLNNAYFEAVSGITTTGATVIYGLDEQGMLNDARVMAPADVMIVPMTDDLEPSVRLATGLRERGIRVQLYAEQKKFKAKIQYADKLHIPYVIFLGEDEVAAGTVS